MYKIERRFTLPIGHRLSKHMGRCFSFHGHNFVVLVGVKAEKLDENDMIMDFSDLDVLVNEFLDTLDHCTILNVVDYEIGSQLRDLGSRIVFVEYDPTAERLSEIIYKNVQLALEGMIVMYPNVTMDYVIVYENEKSKATYLED